jgi:hypothetical protein
MQRLAMTMGAERNEDALKVGQGILRAINKPEKRGMRRGIYKTLTPVHLFSPMGLYVGPSFEMTLDGERLDRILRKVTVGMLWEMTKRRMKAERKAQGIKGFSEADVPRLPRDYRVVVHQVGQAPDHAGMQRTEQNLLALPPLSIGKGTFVYRFLIDEGDPFLSVWRFEFYGLYAFMGYTAKDNGTDSTLLCVPELPPELLTPPRPQPH